MPLSVYVHIPYCLQRCRYCDFTTFEKSEILPPDKYVGQVLSEIRNRRSLWQENEIATLYFGGGTPSLIAPEMIVTISRELEKEGFRFLEGAERTIEINPATITPQKLDVYLDGGINRFSVGAQSFNDALLTMCGRKHSAQDTRDTLKLLRGQNYSFDLLFALPGQTAQDLDRDLEEVLELAPPHLSAYCLTVPEGHPMSLGRPPEQAQLKMFDRIESELKKANLLKYEISNFAVPGKESRHNSVYWQDRNYWGIGLSSHSYKRDAGPYGTRFWNPKSLLKYAEQVEREGDAFESLLPKDQFERLELHESLTDFSHMFLRTMRGLPETALQHRYSPELGLQVDERMKVCESRGWLEKIAGFWRLTPAGQLISNQVFEELTFLREDLKKDVLSAVP